MIRDDNGQIKFNGVDDFEDQPVAAFLNLAFNQEAVGVEQFFNRFDNYTRCLNSKYLFSRDQTLCLVAYFAILKRYELVSQSLVDGKDIFSPANKGHLARCAGKKASWFQDQWLKAEILFHAYFTPTEESNQLIAMMWIAGPEYLKLWVKHNDDWAESIIKYFTGWRNEPELATVMIQKIHEVTSA